MIIFAIRDRLVNWYIQPPFFANSENQAKASLAELVNGESKHAVTQAPHHFELWKLGVLDEDTGAIFEEREFLGDCSSFVRTSLRPANIQPSGDHQTGGPATRSTNAPERTSGTTRADPSALSVAPPGEAREGNPEHQGNRRSP